MSVLYANRVNSYGTDDKSDYPRLTKEELQAVREHEPEQRARVVESLLADVLKPVSKERADEIARALSGPQGHEQLTLVDADVATEVRRYLGRERGTKQHEDEK